MNNKKIGISACEIIKPSKSRSTRRLCQEHLACKGFASAKFYCEECNTDQCEACSFLVHENGKYTSHSPKKIEYPSPELLCQNNCSDINLADVVCELCNKNLCFSCDKKIHQGKKNKTHYRSPFVTLSEQSDSYLSAEPLTDENSSMLSLNSQPYSLPDVAYDSMNTTSDSSSPPVIESTEIRKPNSYSSFVVVDEKEQLQISDAEEFLQKLSCPSNTPVKVISIFGNTGEGKSHTLNHAFFNGKEVFKTSAAQSSCTIGVWAAYNRAFNVVTIDTEGLLGMTANQNQRTRLLLKVLAVSDIVIFRTRAERLHNDLFTFLGDASSAYLKHFKNELRAISERCGFMGPLSSLGPAVIVFHETLHTDILKKGVHAPEDQLKMRFQELGQTIDAFSALEYVGTRTIKPPTSFKELQNAVQRHLQNSTIRSSRSPSVIFTALKVLNEKFSGDIEKVIAHTFPDEYFTCSVHCLSCNTRCCNSMNHQQSGIPHHTSNKCRYQHQFENRIFLCKSCYEDGRNEIVIPKTSASTDSAWMAIAKYAWAGYVLECPKCGLIYRSRQFWYGNKEPWETVVRIEIQHLWPGEVVAPHSTENAAQRVIEGVQDISGKMRSISAKPSKLIGSWITDQINPAYWVPNSEISNCKGCNKLFGELDCKHHCRACGNGFCDDCSSHTRPVPERGWGLEPVRVCKGCYDKDASDHHSIQGNELTARKVGEVIHSTFSTVASAIDYPLGFIKDSARPTYWVPDSEITRCKTCLTDFGPKVPLHHCRACGQGVCGPCSPYLKAVPSRGWDYPVRVCKNCEVKTNL